MAVLGTSPVGADVLHAATVALARQYEPGAARFVLAPLVAAADDASDAAAEALAGSGHPYEVVSAAELRDVLGKLDGGPTYLVVFGVDAASGLFASGDPGTFRSGLDDLRAVLSTGPARGVHLLGWWRTVRRFTEDVGPDGGADVACLVVLNVPANEMGALAGQYTLDWRPRPNRALLIDRHVEHSDGAGRPPADSPNRPPPVSSTKSGSWRAAA